MGFNLVFKGLINKTAVTIKYCLCCHSYNINFIWNLLSKTKKTRKMIPTLGCPISVIHSTHINPKSVNFDNYIQIINSPSFHSRVLGLMIPNSSSLVTAFGFRSLKIGFRFVFWYALNKVFQTCVLPVPAFPTTNTEWRTSSSSSNCTTCKQHNHPAANREVLVIHAAICPSKM